MSQTFQVQLLLALAQQQKFLLMQALSSRLSPLPPRFPLRVLELAPQSPLLLLLQLLQEQLAEHSQLSLQELAVELSLSRQPSPLLVAMSFPSLAH